jgi:hypothetical protein
MKRNWSNYAFETSKSFDNSEGWTAVDLYRSKADDSVKAARVVYWDAVGQHFLELYVEEVPIVVIEELIAEARSVLRVR